MSVPLNDESPNWPSLWHFGTCWAGKLIAGLLLPGGERLKIMTRVIERLLTSHPVLPGALQAHAFIPSTAVQLALTADCEASPPAVHIPLLQTRQHLLPNFLSHEHRLGLPASSFLRQRLFQPHFAFIPRMSKLVRQQGGHPLPK
jgi:hypothetical protein